MTSMSEGAKYIREYNVSLPWPLILYIVLFATKKLNMGPFKSQIRLHFDLYQSVNVARPHFF